MTPKIEPAHYAHCRKCVIGELRAYLEVLLADDGSAIQIWCKHHEENIGVFYLATQPPTEVTLIVLEGSAKVLARMPAVLEQVRVGRDFYVGQKRYVVSGTNRDNPNQMTVTVHDPNPVVEGT